MADLDPQQRQKLILGVIVFLGLGYVTYNYVYSPRAAEIATMEQRLADIQAKNSTARALVQQQGREEVERKLAVFREQLGRVEGLIPSSEELPDLLDAISAQASRTGVDLSLIQPVGATAETYYTRRTYDLAVLGSYHEIGEFLTEIGSLPRIITPINLNVTVKDDNAKTGESRLEAKFSIETYVLPSGQVAADTAHAD